MSQTVWNDQGVPAREKSVHLLHLASGNVHDRCSPNHGTVRESEA